MAFSVRVLAKDSFREFSTSSDLLVKSKWFAQRLGMLGWTAPAGTVLPMTIEIPAPHTSGALESFIGFIQGKDPMTDTDFLKKHGIDAYILSHHLEFTDFTHHCEHMLDDGFDKGILKPSFGQIKTLLNTVGVPTRIRTRLCENTADQMIDDTLELCEGDEILVGNTTWRFICTIIAAKARKYKLRDIETAPTGSSRQHDTNAGFGCSSVHNSLFSSNEQAYSNAASTNLFGQGCSFGQHNDSGFGGNLGSRSNSGGLFGNSSSSQQTGGSLFGNPLSSQNSSTGLFGNRQPSQQAGGGLFGGNNSSLFGNNHKAQSGSSGLFGCSQPATTGIFGGQQPAQQKTGGLFGGNNSSLFGNNNYNRGSNLFDGLQAGAQSHSPFGNPQQSRSLFGGQGSLNNAATNAGTGSLFGRSNTTTTTAADTSRLFGNNKSSSQSYCHDPAQHACWAASPNTQAAPCGKFAGSFNTNAHTNVSPFGTIPLHNASRTFGDGSGTFQESSQPGHFCAGPSYTYNIGNITTSEPRFFPTVEKEASGTTAVYQHISFQDRYRHMSPEEIRLIDQNIDQQASRSQSRQQSGRFGVPGFSFGASQASVPMHKLNPDKALEQLSDKIESQQQELEILKGQLAEKKREETKQESESTFSKLISDLGEQLANIQKDTEAIKARQDKQEQQTSQATEAAVPDDNKVSNTSTPITGPTPASSIHASVVDEAAADGDDFVTVET